MRSSILKGQGGQNPTLQSMIIHFLIEKLVCTVAKLCIPFWGRQTD